MVLDIAILPLNIIFMPEWTLLVTIYWTLALPTKVNIGTAWVIGFLMDIFRDTPMGTYALCMTSAALFVYIFHQRIRYYPIWQQCLVIIIIATLFQIVSLWLRTDANVNHGLWGYFAIPLSSALFWPLVYYSLRHVRRSFHLI